MSKVFRGYFLVSNLIRYWMQRRAKHRNINGPIHLVFCNVDHYEPGGAGGVDKATEIARVDRLLDRYPALADRHVDSDRKVACRTWFFPPHDHRHGSLKKLVSLCAAGYGEIELHLHHGKTCSDTPDNLKATLSACLEEYGQLGIFGEVDRQKKYGFIHGDWALDNSRNGKYCGVNNEIQILDETGCYADFTFPSPDQSNPAQINSLYYAIDDPHSPKSHNHGMPVTKGRLDQKGLMIIQGPLHPFTPNSSLLSLRMFGDEINGNPRVCSRRVDAWVATGIGINGVEDVVFVKTHTHGATDESAVLGQEMEEILAHLEAHYNDGMYYRLHYVTAREMYNIIKALESGLPPEGVGDYRDYLVRPPVYDPSTTISGASAKLQSLIERTYR